MNKTYRLVWCSFRNAWIAVSELSKSKTKSSKTRTIGSVIAAGLMLTFSAGAFAYVAPNDICQPNPAPNQQNTTNSFYGQNIVCDWNTTYSTLVGNNITAAGNSVNLVAVGNNISTGGERSTVLGSKITHSGRFTTVIGQNINSNTEHSIVMGEDTTIDGGNYDISIGGNQNILNSHRTVALGNNIKTSESLDSLAAGNNTAIIKSRLATAVGDRTSVTDSTASSAFGAGSSIKKADHSTAVGAGASVNESNSSFAGGEKALVTGGYGDIAIGSSSTVSNATQSTAIGYQSSVTGNSRGMALGTLANVTDSYGGTALGASTSVSSSTASSAIGAGSSVTGGNDSSAIGKSAKVSDSKFSTAVGTSASVTSSHFALASGASANVTNGFASSAIGNNAKVTDSTGAQAVGPKAAVVSSSNASAFGNNASVTNSVSASASGNNASVTDSSYAQADGAGAKVTSSKSATAVGNDAIVTNSGSGVAIGNKAKLDSAADGIAIGSSANVTSVANGIAIGKNVKVDGENSVSLGPNSAVSAVQATAIGSLANATKDNSVALGANATTDTDATQQASATLNGLNYGTFEGQVTDPGMQVSVGSVGAERQIKNVGSGEISTTSTDAINGSQLYATNAVLGNVANSTKNIIGGDVTLDAAGNVTGPFIANSNSYTTIAEAIEGEAAAAKTEVEEGKNISVTSTTGTDGQTIYTVATADEVEFDKVTVGSVVVDAANNDITGLANTTLGAADFATAGRAATEEQLSSVSDSVADIIGGGVTNVGGSITGPFTANGTDYNNIAEAIEGEAAAAKTEVEEGKNISVTSTTGTDGQTIYTVATADEVEFDKVTVGSVVVDAANNDITGLANTTLGAADFATAGRAATEEQLSSVSDSVADIIGGGVTNVGGSITGPFTANGTDYNNIAEAIEGEAAAAKTEVEEGKNISVTSTTGTDGQTIYTVATADEVEFDKVTVGSVVVDAANNDITGLANTTLGAADFATAGRAATEEQLSSVSDSVADIIGGGVTNVGGSITGPFTANGTDYNNIAEAIEGEAAAAKTEVEEGKNISVTSTTGTDGQTIYTVATADEVEFDKVTVGSVVVDAANNDITGLANTTLGAADFATAGRAATEEQLSSVSDSVADIIGGGVTNVGGSITGPFTANGTDYNNIAEAIEGEAAAAKTEVEEGKNISVTSTTGTDGQTIYTVATADEVEFDKVTVGSVVVDAANNDITGLANTTLGAADFATAGRAATEEQLSSVSDSVADIIGGGVTNVGGSITGPFTANGTDYNNIAEAIEGEAAAAKTEVEEGKNISVTSTTGTDGQTIYTVATADEVEFDKVTVGSVVVDAANNDITGLANTTLGAADFATAGRAATEEQLSSVSDSVADIIGGGVTNVGGSITGPFTANGTDYNNIAEAIEGEAAAAKTEVEEGKNISVTSTTGTDGQTIYTVATADEVEFDKVTVGNTTITTDGLTIVGGPSITTAGINAGGKKVTNVADGEIAEDSTDAVNGSQLYALGDNITNIFGGNANYANNQIIWTNIGGTGKDTIDEAIQYVNNQATNANQGWKVITDSGTAATSTVKPGDIVNIKGDTASGVTVTNSGNDITVGLGDQITVGTGANAVSIDGNGGTIQVGDINIDGTTNTITAGKVSLNGDSGTVNGLTNITWNPADIVSGQAATEDQLKQVADNAAQAAAAAKSTVTEGENVTVTQSKNADGSTNYQVATKKDVTFDSVTSGSVSADKVIVGNVVIDQAGISAGGNKVSNLADGTISSTSKDAINGSQLHASNTNIYNYLGGGANYETNTGPTYNVGGGSHNNVGDALDALDDRDTQLDNKITNLGDQLQQAFYTTNERIDGVEKRANAGIAAAMALETAPYVAGKWTYAAATAYHGGENAVGVTLRKTADNGRWSLTGGIAAASEGDPSFRIGISGVID